MGRDSRFKVFDIEDGIMSSYILLCIFWAQKPAGDLFSFFPAAVESSLCTRGELLPPKLKGQRPTLRWAASGCRYVLRAMQSQCGLSTARRWSVPPHSSVTW